MELFFVMMLAIVTVYRLVTTTASSGQLSVFILSWNLGIPQTSFRFLFLLSGVVKGVRYIEVLILK